MKRHCVKVKNISSSGTHGMCTQENVANLVQAFVEFVQNTDATNGDSWGFELEIYSE